MDKVTALTDDPTAEIAITLDGVPIINESSPEWAVGENTLVITVTDGELTSTYTVVVTKKSTLSALTIGAKTLDPLFDKDILAYAVATTDATNTVTATANSDDAVVEIKLGEAVISNGSAATWEAGVNTLTITVTEETLVVTYVVTVTKGE